MNPNTTLCLACSSSLPPRLLATVGRPNTILTLNPADGVLFLTRCCTRPICPTCLARSPRLARYDPCLQCLGGVRAVAGARGPGEVENVDGAVRDEDVYAVGDDDDDDEEDEVDEGRSGSLSPTTPPPAYAPEPELTVETVRKPLATDGSTTADALPPSFSGTPEADPAPTKYYIKAGDTLLGIALRFGVEGRALCRLNALPPSTLSTTPHLLHTRTFLTLPPSGKCKGPDLSPPQSSDPMEDKRRARERAQKRFQFVTKEVDWRIARTYVALAEDLDEPDSSITWSTKGGEKKAGGKHGGEGPLESRAVERYMDDDEWEAQERRAGRSVRVPRFPLTRDGDGTGTESPGATKGWWARRG